MQKETKEIISDDTSNTEKQSKKDFSPDLNDATNLEQQHSKEESTLNIPEPTSPSNVDNKENKKQEKNVLKEDNDLLALKTEETLLISKSDDKSLLNANKQNYASVGSQINSKRKNSLGNSTTDYAPENNSKWKCFLYCLPGLILAGTGTGLLFVKTNSPVTQGKINLAGFIILVAGIVATIAPLCSCGSSKSDENNFEDEPQNDDIVSITP